MRGARIIAIVAAVMALLGGGSVVASAADGVAAARAARVDACFKGGCGSATFTKVSNRYYKPVKMSVKDNKCDGHPVYIQAGVWDVASDTDPTWLRKNYNNTGCKGGYAQWNSYISWKRPIKFLVFRVCVNDAGPDTCRIAS